MPQPSRISPEHVQAGDRIRVVRWMDDVQVTTEGVVASIEHVDDITYLSSDEGVIIAKRERNYPDVSMTVVLLDRPQATQPMLSMFESVKERMSDNG